MSEISASENAPAKLCIENNSHVRTDAATPELLRRKNYVPLDRDVFRDEKVSFAARSLFAFLLLLDPYETPTVEWIAKQTQHGKSKVISLLNELQTAGWIKKRPLKWKGASRAILDLLHAQTWPSSTRKSVLIETDPNQPSLNGPVPDRTDSDLNGTDPENSVPDRTDSVLNGTDTSSSQFQTEPTGDWVGSEQNRPDESNPCPATVSDPLIEAENNLSRLKGKEKERETANAAILSLDERRLSNSAKKEKQPNWVGCAKLVESCFAPDSDFVYNELNKHFERLQFDPKQMLSFAMYVRDVRDGRDKDTGQFAANYLALRELWEDFLGPQKFRPERKKIR